MTFGKRTPADAKKVANRVDELLEAARLKGITTKGLQRATHLVKEKYKDMWRIMLGPDDVADVVLFCVSPLARWMSGCAIPVDGGGEGAAYLDAATGEVNRT